MKNGSDFSESGSSGRNGKKPEIQFFVVTACRNSTKLINQMTNYQRPELISTCGHGVVEAVSVSSEQVNNLRNSPYSVEIYCRRGPTGYAYPENKFWENEQAEQRVLKKKDRNFRNEKEKAPAYSA